jgi:hypothetical protein
MKEETYESHSKGRLIAASIFVGIIILSVVGWLEAEKAIKTQAIDGCLRLVTVETEGPDGQKIRVPEQYWFGYCMDQKGYGMPQAQPESK